MGHVDTRNNVRLIPNPCAIPLSTYPMQAYMSVALNYLFSGSIKDRSSPRPIES
jgi:hypothetical protein